MSYVDTGSFFAVGVSFAVLGIAAVSARLYVRAKKSGLGIDDWCSVVALALVMGECGIMIAASVTNVGGTHSPSGLGLGAFAHIDDQQELLEKFETSFDLIQTLTLLSLKLTILTFYRRLFRGRVFNIASWTLIGFSIAWAVTFFIAIAAACGTKFYVNFLSLGLLKEECVDTFAILICLAVFDVVVDLGILITPIPLVWSLQMPVRRKVAVTGTLLVGALAIACGITRMAIFAQILGPAVLSVTEVGGDSSDDLRGVVSVLMFWGMLEMGVGIVAVCLPTLRPIFQGLSPESVLRSLRSLVTLRSTSSGGRSRHSHEAYTKALENSDSSHSLARPGKALVPSHGVQNEVHAWRTSSRPSQESSHEMNSVWVNRDFTQTVNHV